MGNEAGLGSLLSIGIPFLLVTLFLFVHFGTGISAGHYASDEIRVPVLSASACAMIDIILGALFCTAVIFFLPEWALFNIS
jgi:hypothetical protein